MGDVIILTEADLRRAVALNLDAISAVEKGFEALAGGDVVMPPILSLPIHAHNGEVDVKTAFVPGLASFAIKVSPGFFDNPKLGLPSTSGLMMVFSSRTGQLEALLLDNGYLTDVRTAAAGAVAARHLSRSDAAHVTIFGAGMQARLQLQALTLVRPVRQATIWARDLSKAEKLAADCREAMSISVAATADRAEAIKAADVIVTTTPATTPLVEADWLGAGQHVTAMGSDQAHKNELAPECLVKADLYVPDRQSQTAILGELRSAISAGLIPPEKAFAELGAIVAGRAPGRTNSKELTVCDLTGTGVQDTAIATFALAAAKKAGLGTHFAT